MKVGVIGFGYWGPNLVRNLFASRRCEQVYCFDAAPQAIHKAIACFPLLTSATSVEDLLAVSDAVMIATPVKSHYILARQALTAGKPVFVEKPMTSSFAEAAKLIDFAAQKKLPLMTGHTFLYSPAVLKIREYLENRTLGEVFSISSSRVNLGLHRQDVNVIWDLAPHDISILLYWLKEAPTSVAAIGRACVGSNIDVASLHLQFPSGCIANIEVSWLAPSKMRRTVIVGSQRMVVYDDTSASEKVKLYDSSARMMNTATTFGEVQLTYRNGDSISPRLENTEPLLAQTHAFLDWLEFNREPEANTWIALQVVAAIEAACRSLQENGRLIEVAGKKPAAQPVSDETDLQPMPAYTK